MFARVSLPDIDDNKYCHQFSKVRSWTWQGVLVVCWAKLQTPVAANELAT